MNARSFNASIRRSRSSRGVLSLSRDIPAPRPTPSSFSRFRVEHQIGVGTLGPVFQGRDVSPDRLVAIKAFTLELSGESAAAFAGQLESLVSLDLTHPSIVRPIDAGLEGDTPYLVGEYVFGESLDVALRRYGPAPAADAARLLTQLAAALDAASLAGVLHGSLHPRDVLVTPDLVRLTGLGVVSSLERAGARAPARPLYSAPELSGGRSWDARADVFSLANVAVELLTGRPVGEQHGSPALDFGAVLVARPEELAQVLLRGLAPRPRDRYATAGGLATAVELALTGRSSRPAHAERVPRASAVARSGEGVRRRRVRPRHDGVVQPEPESHVAAMASLQPALAGLGDEAIAAAAMTAGASEPETRSIDGALRPADPGVLPVDAEFRRPDAGQGSPGEGDVPPIDVSPAAPEAPEMGDSLRLTAPESGRPAAEPDLVGLPAVEGPFAAGVPAATGNDLPLEPRSGVADLVIEQPGSLPFDERELPPPALGPGVERGDGGLEDQTGETAAEGRKTEEGERAGRRSWVLLGAIAGAAALIIGIYGGYRTGIGRSAPPLGSATVSVPSATPPRVPAAPDIYLPAPPKPGPTGTPGPGARQAPAPQKTAKATGAPKAASSATPTARRPAAQAGPGSLSVESRPTGARVFVDGRLSGTTPLVLSRVSAGSHDVRMERAGYRRWSSRIRVVSGRRARLTASLEPESIR